MYKLEKKSRSGVDQWEVIKEKLNLLRTMFLKGEIDKYESQVNNTTGSSKDSSKDSSRVYVNKLKSPREIVTSASSNEPVFPSILAPVVERSVDMEEEKSHENSLISAGSRFGTIVKEEFIKKLHVHFQSKPIQDCMSFINTFSNLINHHINKMAKRYKERLSDEEKEEFFIFIRDYLDEEKLVVGELYHYLCLNNKYNSLDAMVASNQTVLEIDKLAKLIATFDIKKDEYNPLEHTLQADIQLY